MSTGDVARIRAFELESVALVADEVNPISEGWMARAPRLPAVWDLNHVGVACAMEFADALELVERHMGELPYRHLVVEHEPSGERLASEFRTAGWRVERNVLMVLRDEPDRKLDTSQVIEPGEEEALELMARWIGEDDELRGSPESLSQVIEASRLTWRARRARRLGVRGGDGSLAGITMLYSDGFVAQVEDVYAVPRERGRGLGKALVTRAAVLARETGHELTFIAGDDNDWPKELYAKVGFAPVAWTWVFHR